MEKIRQVLHDKDEMNAKADELGSDTRGSERYGRDTDSSIPSYAGSGSGQGITSNTGSSYDDPSEAKPYRSGGDSQTTGTDSYDRSSAGGYGGDDYSRTTRTTGSNMGTDSDMSDIPVQQNHARHAVPGGRAYGTDNTDDTRGSYGGSSYDRTDDRDTSYGTSGSTGDKPSLKDRLDPRVETDSDRSRYGGGDTKGSSGYGSTGDSSRYGGGDTTGSSGYGNTGDRDTSYGTSGSTRNDPSLKDRLDPRVDTESDRSRYGGGGTTGSSGYGSTGDSSRYEGGDTMGSSGYGSSGYDNTRDPDMNQASESSRGNSGADRVYREDGYP